MFIDIAIVVALLIAIYVGYQRGVVQPLLVEIFFLIALLIIIRDRHAYQAAMEKYLHTNAVLDVFLALIVAVVAGFVGGQLGAMIHRMPVVRGVDGFLGVFVHAGFAILISYVLLSALVAFDKAFSPTVNAASLTLKQVQTLQSNIEGNPLAAFFVDEKDLAKLRQEATTSGGARLETVSQLSQLQNFYEQFLQPQLASSRAAPIIMSIGQKIPVIGHAGPKDLPKTAVSPTPKPSPSPSPTKK
ncbi:MAG: CvpA family protein [Chloroflexi bacterium]|nr:MAG: CvpA family protein [Chloroflexota bacterium]